jgi:hypothetical protein
MEVIYGNRKENRLPSHVRAVVTHAPLATAPPILDMPKQNTNVEDTVTHHSPVLLAWVVGSTE